jgi:hypothetical protein
MQRLKDWLQKIKNRWNNKNLVRCRYLPNAIVDTDVLLEHTVFEVFSQFMESKVDVVDWYSDEEEKVLFEGKERYLIDCLSLIYDWYHNWYETKRVEYINEPYDSVIFPEAVRTPSSNPELMHIEFVFPTDEDEAAFEAANKECETRMCLVEDKLSAYINFIIKHRKRLWS